MIMSRPCVSRFIYQVTTKINNAKRMTDKNRVERMFHIGDTVSVVKSLFAYNYIVSSILIQLICIQSCK